MDRRNGGDPLAPPRPPKSLPRVHRPRAQEPPIMSAPNTTTNINIINNNNNNSSILPHLSPKPQHLLNLTAATTTPTTIRNNNNNSISLSSSSSSSATFSSPTTAVVPLIAPLTPLHSRNTNSSLILSSNQSISTFSRRRPPATLPISSLTPAIPAATTTTTSSSNNLDITSSSTTTTLSPVTLASPRPESKRSPNVYVDTPIINRLSPHHQHHHTTANHQLLSSGVTVGPNRQISSVSPSTNLHSNNNNINNNNNNSNSNSVNNNNNNSNVNSNSGVISQTTNTKAISSSPTTTPTPATTTTATSKTINNNNTISRPNILPLGTTTNNNNNHKQLLPIITKQPVSENSTSKFTSNSASLHEDVDIVHSATTNGDSFNSITCPQCKRCRCEECQRPRQLPSKWLCDNTCLCSAETIIDYASCLCCVKALYYHCSKDHEMERESDTIACADDPCSCLPYKRTTRWGCLGALSLALPCLWCYWPMRGCVSVCANCYAKHSRHGCRCQTNNSRHGNPAVVAGGGGGVVGLGGGAAPGGLSSAATLDVSNSKFNNITNVLQTNTRNINRHHSHKNHHHHHHTNSDDLTTVEKRMELEGVSSGKKYVLAEKSMLLDYSSPE